MSKNGTLLASYQYNWKGLRVKKERPAAADGESRITYYIYSPNGKILYEEDETQGDTTPETKDYRQYVYLFGRHFAREDGTISSTGEAVVPDKVFYHTDHLGSTVAITDGSGDTDESGDVVWSNEFTPFGSLADEANKPEAGAKYTGKDYDQDAQLYYSNARWYDPETGRFTSLDPIRDGLNWYVYCGNNPMNRVDPTGLWEIGWGADLTEDGWVINHDDPTKDSDSGSGRNISGHREIEFITFSKEWQKQNNFSPTMYDGVYRPQENDRERFFRKVQEIVIPFDGAIPLDPFLLPGEICPPLFLNPDGTIGPGVLNADKIDWTDPPANPDELGEEWEEVTDPGNKTGNYREFENKTTKEKIRFDKGIPGKDGWEGRDHWHRYNPKATGKKDLYLDKNGNPCGKYSEPSHLFPKTPVERFFQGIWDFFFPPPKPKADPYQFGGSIFS